MRPMDDSPADASAGGDEHVLLALTSDRLMALRVTACGEALLRARAAGDDLQLALDSVRFRLLAATAAANEAARAAEQAADLLEAAPPPVAEVERLIQLAGSTLPAD